MYFIYDKDCFYFFQYLAAYFDVPKKILFSYIAQSKKKTFNLSQLLSRGTQGCALPLHYL